MTSFDRALTDIFGGRDKDFSEHLRGLLRQLYERGAADNIEEAWTDGRPHVAVGETVSEVRNLRVGDRFQNEYLRGVGSERVVVGWRPGEDGTGVILTQLVRESDGGTIEPAAEFGAHKLAQYGPYRRTS